MQGNAHIPHKPSLRLIRQGFPDRPAFGTGVSEAILTRVAAGELPATVRIHRPARELAFSKQDRAAPGFEAAVAAARQAGFEPVVRLAGGRAAVFTEGTLALAWATPAERPVAGTRDRFELLADIVVAALRSLGVDARIGEIPGEYCPGAWSVSAGGRTKLAGIGQRLISGAAHSGAVLVVTGSDVVRAALEPAYAALDLDWDPSTAGSVEDEVPQTTLADAEAALEAELASRYELVEAELDDATLELAAELEADHRPLRRPRAG
jgi:octanoyl-[GcvH]:protein N-octanoyltransferase